MCTQACQTLHMYIYIRIYTYIYIYIICIYLYLRLYYMDPMRLLLYGHLLATMAAIAPIEILMPSSVCHPSFQPSASALHRDLYSNGINHCTIWTHIESAAKKPHWMKVSSSVLCKQPQRGDPAIFKGYAAMPTSSDLWLVTVHRSSWDDRSNRSSRNPIVFSLCPSTWPCSQGPDT